MNIGVFDSGVGGLWILKHLQEKLPSYHYLYVADQAHVPYGQKSLAEIKQFCETITDFLISEKCQVIVIACNTASAASLKYLREQFPDTLFVGMEPAVKPAAQITKTGKIGVLATTATFQGELYHSLVEKFAQDIEIFTNPCVGLVNQIERGEFASPVTRSILEDAILPMLKQGVDTLVLGCTHYPFVTPLIREIAGQEVQVIDPTAAVVRQVKRIITENNLLTVTRENNETQIFTSGDAERMQSILLKLFNKNIETKKANGIA